MRVPSIANLHPYGPGGLRKFVAPAVEDRFGIAAGLQRSGQERWLEAPDRGGLTLELEELRRGRCEVLPIAGLRPPAAVPAATAGRPGVGNQPGDLSAVPHAVVSQQ